MSEPEKIGLVEWFEVRRHSRMLYLRLDPKDTHIHGIQPGDKLKVEIQAIRRAPREEVS